MRYWRAEHGFTLSELLLALCLTLIVVGGGLTLLTSQLTSAQVVPVAVDRQQRGRAALSVLATDLLGVGAGLDEGPLAGGLSRLFAPAVPRRVGLTGTDSVATARPDLITLVTVPWTSLWTTTAAAMAGDMPVVGLQARPPCAPAGPSCGIEEGMTVMVFDRTGRHGAYRVTDVTGSVLGLRGLQPSSPGFTAGAVVVPAQLRTYYFDRAARQLRSYDGYLSDVPIVDDVVGVRFEYWGEPEPPRVPRPPAGESNCLFDAAGQAAAGLGHLATAGDSLAPLSLDLFRDGPWCGEGGRQFDADLLRIRAVKAQVRVQAEDRQFRLLGPNYALAGTNTRARALVPDMTLSFEVTPRNLNLGR